MPFTQYITLLSTYLQPQQRRVLLLASLLLTGLGLQLLSPQLIRRFIDTVQAGGAQSALYLAAFLFLAITLTQRVVEILTTYISQQVAWTATNGLRHARLHTPSAAALQ